MSCCKPWARFIKILQKIQKQQNVETVCHFDKTLKLTYAGWKSNALTSEPWHCSLVPGLAVTMTTQFIKIQPRCGRDLRKLLTGWGRQKGISWRQALIVARWTEQTSTLLSTQPRGLPPQHPSSSSSSSSSPSPSPSPSSSWVFLSPTVLTKYFSQQQFVSRIYRRHRPLNNLNEIHQPLISKNKAIKVCMYNNNTTRQNSEC